MLVFLKSGQAKRKAGSYRQEFLHGYGGCKPVTL